MAFTYSQLTTDLFDSGGRPVPINNRPPQTLKDWAVFEGATVLTTDTSLLVLRKIATARGVSYLAGDDFLTLLKKIAVASPERGTTMLLQEIIAESGAVEAIVPVLTYDALSEALTWPGATVGVDYSPGYDGIEIDQSGDEVNWSPFDAVPLGDETYGGIAPSAGMFLRARFTGSGVDPSGWSNIVELT